ncbi:MAG: TonB-dependent receptor [Saprospiraceae bacterium]
MGKETPNSLQNRLGLLPENFSEMSTQKLLATLLFMAISVAQATAQNPSGSITLSGKVQDAEAKAPLAFLSVVLKTEKDSAFVAGTLTDETGAFTLSGLKKGTYSLEASFIGYQTLRQRVIVGELSAFLDLGVLQMKEDAKALGEVVVSAKADAVSGKMDKKTYAVGDNISQSGGSVLRAMTNLPGVTVGEDGKIQLRGSDKIAVLIDGKQTALTGYGSQTGLDNLPASALERIEIINNPSAKYDANASAGVINLVFKKQEQQGFNGKVSMMVGAGALWEKRENLPTIRPQFQATPKLNPSFSTNYRKKGTNIFFQGDWLYSPTLNKNEFSTRTYDDGIVIFQQVKRNRTTDYLTAKTGLDHAFNGRNSWTVSGLFNREKIIDNGDQPFFLHNTKADNRYRLWQFLEDEVKYTMLGTTVFTHKFQQPGHTLILTGNYSFHREDEKYFFTNTLPDFTGEDAFKLLSDEHVWDLNADYTKPLRQGRIEAGFKGRFRSIPVNMQFFPGQNSPLDTSAGGWANYYEKIPALYSNYVFENEKVEIEGGLRVEFVEVDYKVNPDHNTYKSNGYRYFQPFPNLRAAYKFNERNKITLFFNRRVDRPNEVDIRIFPKYDEPELIKVGNPALQPQFTMSGELGFKNSFSKGSFYAAIYHRIIDGTITRIATQVPGSVLLYNVFQNAGRSWNTGAEFVWQQKIYTWLSLNANANIYQNAFDAFTVVNLYPVPTTYSAEKQQLVSGNFKLNAAIKAPKNWEAQISSIWLAPDLLPQGRIGSRYSLDVGIKKIVQKGKGELVFNATDLLNTMQIKKSIQGTNFRLESTDYYETQVIRLGYNWKF